MRSLTFSTTTTTTSQSSSHSHVYSSSPATLTPLVPPAPRTAPALAELTLSHVLVDALAQLGVREAFGVVGGAIAPFCDVLGRASMPRVYAMRHEAGAAFAAAEASLATGRPALVFTTTGPGLTNALTGIVGARSEGAHVIVVVGATSSPHRGRGAVQETSDLGYFSLDALARCFDVAVTVESGRELEVVAARLAHGCARPGGFAALVALPLARQRAPVVVGSTKESATGNVSARIPVPVVATAPRRAASTTIHMVAELLAEPFAIWAGFGARRASAAIRELAERCGARVICTPRGKGVFPETHPLFVGVSGFGGHAAVETLIEQHGIHRVLVLGTRLGEFSSVWDPRLVPPGGFVHVDVDDTAFNAAYPTAQTMPVVADVGAFVEDLLAVVGPRTPRALPSAVIHPTLLGRDAGPVRPQMLMQTIQRRVVDATDSVVMAEPGNSFAWTTNLLRFEAPGRYRMSGSWASMGHMTTGAVGAAVASNRRHVVVTGDGAMLMLNELSSAAQYRARVVWVVLNDARYGITEAGMSAQGFQPVETRFPACDFVSVALGMGVDGVRVESEHELERTFAQAMEAPGPFVIDVVIDAAERAPFLRRIQVLAAMGANREQQPAAALRERHR